MVKTIVNKYFGGFKMNAVIIYAHPNPASFNASIAKIVQEELEKKGATVKVKDLYAMKFNPLLSAEDFAGFHNGNIPADIAHEQKDIKAADIIVFAAPIWWSSVPAILRGYMDRIFSIGFAYEYTKTGPRGLLTDKKGLFITTSGADAKSAEASGMQNVITHSLVNGFLGFCGFAEYKGKNLCAVTTVTDEERKDMLTEIRQLITQFA